MTQSVSVISNRSKRQALMWLIVAAVMLIVWVLVSLFNHVPTTIKEHKKTQAVAEEMSLPSTIDHLDELTREVPPIDFETVVRDLRNYPNEFKGKKFFEDNSKRWTVQVMDVAQNEIITEYLNGRADREKFAYFRYHNSNNEQRYILTYGVMGSPQEALGAIKVVDFGLPPSVTPMSEEMKRYAGMIDNYERSEVMVDLSESAPRAVTLKPTKKEIPAEASKKEDALKKEEASKEVKKPKSAEKETMVNTDLEKSEVLAKPKMPPTAIPKDMDKPKENKKEDKVDNKPTPKTDSNDKSAKPIQEANVADLEPAPPMNMPGDE